MALNEFFTTEDFQKSHTSRLSAPNIEARYGLNLLGPHLFGASETPRVLDVACGAGQAGEVFRRWFPTARYTGLDFSPSMLVDARRRYPDQEFIQFEFVDRLPFDDASFDLVYEFDIIEHVASPYELLTEALRVSRRYTAFTLRCSHLPSDGVFRKPKDVRFNVLSWRRVRERLEQATGGGLRVTVQVAYYQPYGPPGFVPLQPTDFDRQLDTVDGARKLHVLVERTTSGTIEWVDATTRPELRGYLFSDSLWGRLRRRAFMMVTPRTWPSRRRQRTRLH